MRGPRLMAGRQSPLVFGQGVRHGRNRQHEVDVARGDGAAGHAVIAGLVGVLCDDQPRFFLDRPEPVAAVGSSAGENDGHGPFGIVFRERVQEEIERQTSAVAGLRLRYAQQAAVDRKIGAGGNDVEVIGLNRHAVGRLLYRHRRMVGEQIDHQAFMRRIEVLHQDEGHAAILGQRGNQLAASVEPAGGSPDADDAKGVDPCRGSFRRRLWRRGRPCRP